MAARIPRGTPVCLQYIPALSLATVAGGFCQPSARRPLATTFFPMKRDPAHPVVHVEYPDWVDSVVDWEQTYPADEERMRLKKILQSQRGGLSGGFIIRTAGEGKSEEDLISDMQFLHSLWMDLKAKAERRPAPVLVHHDLDIVQRIIRDQLTTTFKNIWLDNEELYESTVHFVERFQPALMNRVRLYTRPTPIFDHFAVTAELEKALRPKVRTNRPAQTVSRGDLGRHGTRPRGSSPPRKEFLASFSAAALYASAKIGEISWEWLWFLKPCRKSSGGN